MNDQHDQPDQPDPTPDPHHDTDDRPDVRAASREAANYRRRLRATEIERDQLRDQLDRVQRAEVERRAADRFAASAPNAATRRRDHEC
jgi:hypothetical protein